MNFFIGPKMPRAFARWFMAKSGHLLTSIEPASCRDIPPMNGLRSVSRLHEIEPLSYAHNALL